MYLWLALLILTVAVSVAIASAWLPSLFLKARYTLDKTRDRGIKKIVEKRGQSILYEPAVRWRKYISQYILSERGGKKELACKVDPALSFLSYDVVLFNACDEVFGVITVKDLLKNKGYAKPVELPKETSYVCLTINQADTTKFPPNLSFKVRAGNVARFLFCTTLCLIAEALCVKVCCANAFGGIFADMFMLDLPNAILTAVVVVLLILLNLIVSAIAIKIRGSKKVRVDK